MLETPTITSSAYTSSHFFVDPAQQQANAGIAARMLADLGAHKSGIAGIAGAAIPQYQPKEPPVTARIVKVFIADPNDNLPLDKRVLYSGDEKLTDMTDQELFYEVPIAEIMGKHNEVRKATVDKKQAEKFGRDIFLEPARIRDLKMVVVTVAQF